MQWNICRMFHHTLSQKIEHKNHKLLDVLPSILTGKKQKVCTYCDITWAMAAPLTPYWKTKINIGSKTILIASPATGRHKNIRHISKNRNPSKKHCHKPLVLHNKSCKWLNIVNYQMLSWIHCSQCWTLQFKFHVFEIWVEKNVLKNIESNA